MPIFILLYVLQKFTFRFQQPQHETLLNCLILPKFSWGFTALIDGTLLSLQSLVELWKSSIPIWVVPSRYPNSQITTNKRDLWFAVLTEGIAFAILFIV